MHYYKRNLGDYAKKAGRLSMLQHGAYTLLIDACYDREEFPTEQQAIEWTWASTPEEEQAVKFVLSRFFYFDEETGKYIQGRINEEIQLYKIGEITNRLIALAREARKQERNTFAEACDQLRAKIKDAPLSKTHEAWSSVVESLINTHESSPNHKPRTTNQEPLTKNHKPLEKDLCSESEKPDSKPEQPQPKILIAFPTNKFNTKQEVFLVDENRVQEFAETYPNVDLPQTLKRMRSWLVNNPGKRKTYRGMPRFIDTWLAKEQDRGGNHYAKSLDANDTSWADGFNDSLHFTADADRQEFDQLAVPPIEGDFSSLEDRGRFPPNGSGNENPMDGGPEGGRH